MPKKTIVKNISDHHMLLIERKGVLKSVSGMKGYHYVSDIDGALLEYYSPGDAQKGKPYATVDTPNYTLAAV